MQEMQQESNDWRSHATEELRTHLVFRIVQSVLCRTDPSETMHDPRMQYVITFAKNVEKKVFDVANSKSEYYHLLAEKIYKIQQELDCRIQQREKNAQSSSSKPLNELSGIFDWPTVSQSNISTSDPGGPPPSGATTCITLHSCDSKMDRFVDNSLSHEPFSEDVPQSATTSSSPASSDTLFLPLMSRDPLNPPAQLPAMSITGSPITQPEQCKMVQQQLAFLIHARYCQHIDIGKNCPQPTCFQMKLVLHHILSCNESRSCSFVNCAFYKDINTHWSICKSSDCPLCLPVALEEILSIYD